MQTIVACAGVLPEVADDMRPVAAIAQRLARFHARLRARDLDLKLALAHRQALDRAALMRLGFQHAAGIGGELIALQPFDRLDPADDGEPAFAVVGNQDRRVGLAGLFEEGFVLRRLQDALDRDVERLRQPPDGRERRIGFIALDLADDRLGDARLLRRVRKATDYRPCAAAARSRRAGPRAPARPASNILCLS